MPTSVASVPAGLGVEPAARPAAALPFSLGLFHPLLQHLSMSGKAVLQLCNALHICSHLNPVGDETQNLNDTKSETFFRDRFRHFFMPNIFGTESKTISEAKFFETDSDTFFNQSFFRLNLGLFLLPIFLKTKSVTINKISSFETKTSHNVCNLIMYTSVKYSFLLFYCSIVLLVGVLCTAVQ